MLSRRVSLVSFRGSRFFSTPVPPASKLSPNPNPIPQVTVVPPVGVPEAGTVAHVSLGSKAKNLYLWVRQTAKEKGKPDMAWYVTLYCGGLLASYGAVRAYGKVEPDVVKEWAYKFKADKIVDLETLDLTKDNCEYLAAVLLNEAFDTPRLILAVLTIDRAILLARKLARK